MAETFTHEDRFDITYSRLLFAHLKSPTAALQAMLHVTLPQGRVVLEDVDVSTINVIPHRPAIDMLKQWLIQLLTLQGCDACIGPKLTKLMEEAGLSPIETTSHQLSATSGSIKRVPKRLLTGIAPALVKAKIATEANIQRILSELEQISADPQSTVYMAKVYQMIGEKN